MILPTTPETEIELTLERLGEYSRRLVTPAKDSPFKIMKNPMMPYISISGPSENIRLMFDAMKLQFPDAEIVNANRTPTARIGFYQSGETPFGIVQTAMGRSRMVVCHYEIEKDDLKKIKDMYHRPEATLAAAIPDRKPAVEQGR